MCALSRRRVVQENKEENEDDEIKEKTKKHGILMASPLL
jgi:hypothetical protein